MPRRLTFLVPSLVASVLAAQDSATSAAPATTLTVVGDRQVDAQRLPGTASVLEAEQLAVHRYDSVHQVLRQVPGATVADEDGYGARANIGLRGVNPVRSTKVHLMEDGVPIAPNPYNDPTMYVNPAYGRFTAVEVIKGSGQILYGPQAVAGVVNFKTDPLAYRDRAGFDIAGGSDSTTRLRAQVEAALGETVTAAVDGYGFTTEGFRPYDDLSQTEIVGRIGWKVADGHRIEAKLFHGTEDSNMTYQGLSRADYADDAYDRYDFTRDDTMEAYRTGIHLRHRWEFADEGSLTTTLYHQDAWRDWVRAEVLFDPVAETYVGTTRTTAGVTRDRSSGDRTYRSQGIETRWHDRFTVGIPVALDTGVRLHGEGQDNLTVDRVATTNEPLVRQAYERDTTAIAGWLQLDLEVADGLHLIPGVRVEHVDISSQRTIANYAPSGEAEGTSTITETMPGFGVTWAMTRNAQLYGGVHRGFSPPSYSQSISNDGTDNELDAETSWNYELGLRWSHGTALAVDVSVFHIDWENIIAQGVAGGPQVNGGESTHTGGELLLSADAGAAADLSFGIPVTIALTQVQAEYDSDVYSGATLVAAKGNEREYSPDTTLSATIGLERLGHRDAIHAYLTATHIGEQYSDGLNTEAVTADGSRGLLDAYTTIDLTVKWKPADARYQVYASGRNILDEEYAAYRRGGQGTVAGAPATVLVGMAASF
jgi:Fe(3+) dicitrate transport protein